LRAELSEPGWYTLAWVISCWSSLILVRSFVRSFVCLFVIFELLLEAKSRFYSHKINLQGNQFDATNAFQLLALSNFLYIHNLSPPSSSQQAQTHHFAQVLETHPLIYAAQGNPLFNPRNNHPFHWDTKQITRAAVMGNSSPFRNKITSTLKQRTLRPSQGNLINTCPSEVFCTEKSGTGTSPCGNACNSEGSFPTSGQTTLR
jgi:hypothetical protein